MIDVRAATENDRERVLDLLQQAFNMPRSHRRVAAESMRLDQIRVSELDGRVVGTLRFWPFAHLFGGRAVRAAGVAAVAVAAEARGKGVGTRMMREAMRELRDAGVLLSSLYPATVPIYRSMGYGFGGVRARWKVAQTSLPERAELGVEPFGDDALDEVNACYERLARTQNGMLERPSWWWRERVWRSWDESPIYRYLVREEGRVTGYMSYQLHQGDTWRSNMNCQDLVWTTEAAARALLATAGMHRSTGSDVEWFGSPAEPIGDLLREDAVEMKSAFRWMLRLVDVPGAVEARGYHPGVEASVTVEIEDDVLPANRGPWRIEVSDGAAKVTPAEHAEVRATVQSFASVWSSLHRPWDASRTGGLVATEAGARALEAMFGGPTPWLGDFY